LTVDGFLGRGSEGVFNVSPLVSSLGFKLIIVNLYLSLSLSQYCDVVMVFIFFDLYSVGFSKVGVARFVYLLDFKEEIWSYMMFARHFAHIFVNKDIGPFSLNNMPFLMFNF